MMDFHILKLNDVNCQNLDIKRLLKYNKNKWKSGKKKKSFLDSFNLTKVEICSKKQNIKIQVEETPIITINRRAFYMENQTPLD